MSLHSDERFLAAVAAALGESVAFVRRRGFHLDPTPSDEAPRRAGRLTRWRAPPPDDAVDLAAHGIDWDAHDERRLRRRRDAATTRNRRKAA